MFARSARGLLDALAAMLCLWVGAYQTPVGALARTAFGRALHVRTTVRPLLAYYSAGVYDEGGDGASTPSVALPPLQGAPASIPENQALLYGVQAALASADASTWERVQTLAASRGVELRGSPLDGRANHESPLPPGEGQGEGADASGTPPHPRPSPGGRGESPLRPIDVVNPPAGEGIAHLASLGSLHQLLDGLGNELGSPELAVAALFCGVDVARFGRDRAQAQGRRPGLEALARVLPPSQSEALALASRAMTMGGAFALRWPVAEETRITSPFGLRTHPLLGTQQQHTGVDLSVPSGTPVHATGAGIVRRASEDAINGKVVIIDHGRGVTTAYCHNSELLVSAGDRVEEGQVISKSGTTGRSTGPHVHYQLELGGKPVDPLRFHRANVAPATSSVAID